MLFEHASYRFPTELLIFFDLLACVLAAALLWRWPALGADSARSAWRELRHLGRGRHRPFVILALAGGLGTAATFALFGPPIPRISDEKSYLLAADTFAHGRLANPPLADAAHYATEHVLFSPTYASKYPPAQGLVLGLGQRLFGHPAAGLILESALLCLCIGWAVGGVMAPPWPLVGGLLAAFRLGVGSYFNQSYWGGSVATIGGALVLGAVLRFSRPSSHARVGDAVALMAGLAVLAHSRPVEGLAYAAVAGLLLLRAKSPARHPTPRQRAPDASVHPVSKTASSEASRATFARKIAIALTLALGSILIVASVLGYNRAVTGHALTFPHPLHASRHPEYVHFVWQLGPRWPLAALRAWLVEIALSLYFYLGLGPLVVLVTGFGAIRGRHGAGIATALSAAVLLALFPILPFHVHYAAPMAAALMLLATLGLRALLASGRRVPSRGPRPARHGRIGRQATMAILAIQCAIFLLQLSAHRPDESDWSFQRAQIQARLLARPGRDLVLVHYPAGRPESWVWNRADLASSEVVWAESLGDQADRPLIEHWHGRRVWEIAPDFGPRPPALRPRAQRPPAHGRPQPATQTTATAANAGQPFPTLP